MCSPISPAASPMTSRASATTAARPPVPGRRLHRVPAPAAGRIAAMTSQDVRSRFVDFFASREHVRLPSGSLVPPDWDTSVLITTAGMQPLKRYFLGADQPPAPRAVSVQKCFRTVDIEEVGRTARHLTFFEMMGNFSFGDYFKPYAVDSAWELSTSPECFGLDPDRVW